MSGVIPNRPATQGGGGPAWVGPLGLESSWLHQAPQQALRQSLRLRINHGRAVGAQLGLEDAAQGVNVWRERAKETGLAVGDHQQGGKVVHLHRVYQFGFVFDVHPDKPRGCEFGL